MISIKMKFYNFKILFFSIVLKILLLLLYSSEKRLKNHYPNTHTKTTKKTTISQLLCEYDVYTSIYDNDPEMKTLMENFDRQTSQRFHEYDQSMIKRRQKCKEQCDKDIQNIILKDKIEKELTEKLSALNTNITTEDIPTCVREKSVADKVEKTCLRCGGILGGGVAPELGLIGATALYAINAWKPGALASAGKAAGIEAGVADLVAELKNMWQMNYLVDKALEDLVTKTTYTNYNLLATSFKFEYQKLCMSQADPSGAFCIIPKENYTTVIENTAKLLVGKANKTVETTTASETARITTALTNEKTAEITDFSTTYNTAIIASIVAIIVIVLVMVIIYLILRYRRKKKNEEKITIHKIIKMIDTMYCDMKSILVYCELFYFIYKDSIIIGF
ncbi:rifin PIR protein, putative [Plasmodium sp. gorilla clade G2]|uniref:rifin PIR protein, putative n=1 Tax=Plasmodium sp. gorilla clade G2 TaxID=880535 RepID=UPI000D201D40|nr:rifin PIR protein, putative [Plasmodium sp. gorilla clade G2]SOV11379.1 rifin PIR protein, putative [Plasmodium sp. gorilla clade G2]